MVDVRTVREAAEQIVALINSRASSPRLEEIEALISKAIGPAVPATLDRLAQLQTAIAAIEAAEDARRPSGGMIATTAAEMDAVRTYDKLCEPLTALSEAVWNTSPRTLTDLKERALIAQHWLDARCDDNARWQLSQPPSELNDSGERAIAELIHAVWLFDGVLPETTSAHSEALVRWDACVREYLAASCGPDEDACARLDDAFCAACEAEWAKPVHALSDLLPRLLVATHWNSPGFPDDPAYPDNIIAETGPAGKELSMDERAVAFVIRGLLDLTGLKCDADGRLLSNPGSNRDI
jgi:hypothetical protein